MQQTKQLLPGIQEDLEGYIKEFDFGKNPRELYQPITYLMGLGGKRVRPLLVLLAYRLYRADYKRALAPASAVEVFHNFTLMHDDIMDQAPLRRGMPTVHEKWNANTAILSGDVMLVKAYDMLLETPQGKLAEAIRLFNRTAAEVCEGQQLDMNFEGESVVSEDAYIEMIRLKTAVLLGFALQLGALLADAPKADAERLYTFGVLVGIGFQLKDDLLDVYADKAKFGKQVGGDIIANKKTYLLIKALELSHGKVKEELTGWIADQNPDKAAKVAAVTAIYDSLGIRSLTEEKIRSYFDQGFSQLSELKTTDEEALALLRTVVEDLINREK
ncbi:polyprenyl synthetase family protein [Lunatimonas salinarum]|uniref:polyprenyl synthetase family protein n=1 Tax=Lunatimonas salinarum TaxID=1774590 RepID=UPI003CC91033